MCYRFRGVSVQRTLCISDCGLGDPKSCVAELEFCISNPEGCYGSIQLAGAIIRMLLYCRGEYFLTKSVIAGSETLNRSPGIHGLQGPDVLWISNWSGARRRLSPQKLPLWLAS